MPDKSILTLEDVERAGSVERLQQAVETALKIGDTDEVDRLLAIWSKFNRRRRALSSLKAAAQTESERLPDESVRHIPIEDMSDEEVCAELERLVGRPFTIKR